MLDGVSVFYRLSLYLRICAVYLRVIRPKTFSAFSACKLFIWWWWWRFVLIGLVAYNVACLRLTAPGFGNVGTHNKANTWKWKNTKIQKYKKTNTKHKMQIQNTDCKKKWKIYHLKKSGFGDFSGFSTFLNLFFSFFFAKSTRQKRPQKNPSRINAANLTSYQIFSERPGTSHPCYIGNKDFGTRRRSSWNSLQLS